MDGIYNISQHKIFEKITENENHTVNMHLINQFGNNMQNKTKHSYLEHWLDFIPGKKNNDPENLKLCTYCICSSCHLFVNFVFSIICSL